MQESRHSSETALGQGLVPGPCWPLAVGRHRITEPNVRLSIRFSITVFGRTAMILIGQTRGYLAQQMPGQQGHRGGSSGSGQVTSPLFEWVMCQKAAKTRLGRWI